MGYLEDPDEELRITNAWMARRDQAAWRASQIPPERVARLNAAAERFPFLTPDAVMAPARSPNPIAAETFGMLGELSTRRWMRDHPNGATYGQRMVTPQMRRSAYQRAQARAGLNYVMQQATRGAEAEEFGGLTTAEGQLRAPADLGRFVSGYKYDPKLAAERAPSEARDIERFVDLARRAAEDAEGDEVTFVDPQGRVHAYNAKTDSFFTPEKGAQPLSVIGELGKIRLPSAHIIPGTPPEQTAGVPTVRDVLRRGAFMPFDIATQEFQGQVRNVYGHFHGKDVDWTQPQSDALIELTTGLESGSGFFPDPESDVAQERRRREAERGKIHGHNVTLGRWIADTTPFAADSKPWMMASGLVDLGVQVVDPVAFTLGVGGKVVRARDVFANPEIYEKAGLWAGIRRTFSPPDVRRFLDSEPGARAIEWLTDTTSPEQIRRGLNRKVNMDLAAELADTRDITETRAVLERVLGPVRGLSPSTLRKVGDPFDTGPGLGVTQAARRGRPTDMPIRGPIDARDKDIVGAELEKWLYNVKGMDDETVERAMSRMARTTGKQEINATVRDAIRDVQRILGDQGYSDEVISELTRLQEGATKKGSETWHDLITRQNQTDDVAVANGEPVWDAGAHLYVEYAPDTLKLPDARAMRRVQSQYSRLLTPQRGERIGQLRMPLAALEAIQGEIWKPIALATRFAWPIRVIGEEQIRMAVAGYDSMFNHPISFIAGRVGKRSGKAAKLEIGPAGDMLAEAAEHKLIVGQAHQNWMDRAARTRHRVTISKTQHERKAYRRALASEISRLANDPVASRVANDESLEGVKSWFTRGSGNKFRGELAQMQPRKFRNTADGESYIESVNRRIQQNTGGSPELLEAVRTGKFRGKNIIDGDAHLDRDFLDGLDGLIDEFGPAEIIGDEYHILGSDSLGALVERWDAAVDRAFGWLMSERTSRLSRSPVFRQEVWNETERIIPWMDEATKQTVIRNAKATNIDGWRVGRSRIKRMEATQARGNLTIDEVDFYAKGVALDKTKELLYDLSKRGRTMDAWRVVFPFGEAWSEVLTRWMGTGKGSQPLGLLWQNPKSIRRFQQLIQGARGEEFGEFMGAPDGKGFFWENEFGEQVFMWPLIGLMTDKILGFPAPLTGRVQGLSMFGTVMPGLGPVAQVPVGWLAANKPGPQPFKEFVSKALAIPLGPFGTVQEQILPFGSVGAEDQAAIFSAWNYAPPWIKSLGQVITQGDVNGKQWNQAVMETAGSLKATGDFGDSIGEQNRLMEEAEKKAWGLYLMKALAGSVAPTAPDIEWMLETNNGNAVRGAALSDELRELRKKVGLDMADEAFMDKYGPDIYSVIATPMTTTSIYKVPATQKGVDWVLAHPGIEDDLPNVFGFFAPEGGDENFSMYAANFRSGAAIKHDPQDWIRLLNHTKGNIEYARAVEEVGDKANTKAGRAYLEAKRDDIRARFPGWGNKKGNLEKADPITLIAELEDALDNPVTRNTDAGQGLALYWEARAEVAAYAEANGLAWPGTSKAMLAGRLYLDEKAQEIIRDHPQFKDLYDYILSRETESLEEQPSG